MNLLAEKNVKFDDTIIYLNLFKLHKSYLLLISDQADMGIGNVTLSSPSMIEGIKPSTASYSLFGVNAKLVSTVIAEKVTHILKAPVLLLLFLKNKKNEEEILKPLVDFLNKILNEILEKSE
ncbi:MAG: hypothetical protein ACFFDF_22890 [Candidatus Odinarchaeota archaeon]